MVTYFMECNKEYAVPLSLSTVNSILAVFKNTKPLNKI